MRARVKQLMKPILLSLSRLYVVAMRYKVAPVAVNAMVASHVINLAKRSRTQVSFLVLRL